MGIFSCPPSAHRDPNQSRHQDTIRLQEGWGQIRCARWGQIHLTFPQGRALPPDAQEVATTTAPGLDHRGAATSDRSLRPQLQRGTATPGERMSTDGGVAFTRQGDTPTRGPTDPRQDQGAPRLRGLGDPALPSQTPPHQCGKSPPPSASHHSPGRSRHSSRVRRRGTTAPLHPRSDPGLPSEVEK